MGILQVLAAVAVVCSATPSAAAITTMVFTGRASGSDAAHLNSTTAPFGTLQTGVDLMTGRTTGLVFFRPFTLTVLVDDSLGDVDTFPSGDIRYGDGAQSPLSASFSMNGYTHDFGNLGSSIAKGFLGQDQLYAGAEEQRLRPPMTGDFRQVWGHLDFNIIFLADVFQERPFTEPLTWFRTPGETADGNLTLTLQDTTGTPLAFVEGPLLTADLDLTFDSLTISSTAVPEPAAWAMMIAGFGLVGAALRRRALAAA